MNYEELTRYIQRMRTVEEYKEAIEEANDAQMSYVVE